MVGSRVVVSCSQVVGRLLLLGMERIGLARSRWTAPTPMSILLRRRDHAPQGA